MMKRWLPALVLTLIVAGTCDAQMFGYARGGYWGGRGWGGAVGRGYYAPGPYYGSTWSPNYYSYTSYYPSNFAYYPTYSYSSWSTPDYYGYRSYSMAPTYAVDNPSLRTYQSFYPSFAPMPVESGNHTALIEVRVPAGAEVLFDGSTTKQTGTFRSFVSPPLESGRDYSYEVQAKWTDENGKAVDQKRTIRVNPGQRTTVDFLSRPDTDRPGGTRTDTDLNRKDRPDTIDKDRPGTTDKDRPGGTTDVPRPGKPAPTIPDKPGGNRPPVGGDRPPQ